MLLILTIAVLFSTKNIIALVYRPDYLWAHQFQTFYHLHDFATTWNQARQICEAEGTSLLVVDSIDEMENLKILFSNMRADYTAVFVGIHDQYSKGDFVTIKGVPIKGTIIDQFWSQGKPDDINGTEHCVVMTREALFDDRPCDDIFPFVCKIYSNQTNYNEKCNNHDLDYVPNSIGKCYKFHVEPLSWHDAYMVCMLEEGQLAVINSPEEANLITSLLGEHIHSDAPDPNILYIGFSDLLFPYQYRTITGKSLEKAGYASWTPLTDDTSSMSTKHCGAISRTGFLTVTYCDQPAMFICERIITNNTETRK